MVPDSTLRSVRVHTPPKRAAKVAMRSGLCRVLLMFSDSA